MPLGHIARRTMRPTVLLVTVGIGAVMTGACAGTSAGIGARSGAMGSMQIDGAREQTADQQVQHVLNRLAFGPRPQDVATVRQMGVDAWVAQQLRPERVADPSVEPLLRQYRTLSYSADQLLQEYPPPGVALAQAARRGGGALSAQDSMQLRQQAREGARALGELASSRVARAVVSERQLEEVLVDFWENHFNVFAGKNITRYFLNDFDRTIRQHAMGDFRTLLGAVAKSPAMLYYLDNWQSVADSGRPVLQP
ncbi:DUF1800 family protein, partial [Gemmatimonas sp.]|uniref:DUF1800 family protein n=1 Tax=Gemmatimonas sp. TaxID=1962908 RepID=UPI0037BF1C1D